MKGNIFMFMICFLSLILILLCGVICCFWCLIFVIFLLILGWGNWWIFMRMVCKYLFLLVGGLICISMCWSLFCMCGLSDINVWLRIWIKWCCFIFFFMLVLMWFGGILLGIWWMKSVMCWVWSCCGGWRSSCCGGDDVGVIMCLFWEKFFGIFGVRRMVVSGEVGYLSFWKCRMLWRCWLRGIFGWRMILVFCIWCFFIWDLLMILIFGLSILDCNCVLVWWYLLGKSVWGWLMFVVSLWNNVVIELKNVGLCNVIIIFVKIWCLW